MLIHRHGRIGDAVATSELQAHRALPDCGIAPARRACDDHRGWSAVRTACSIAGGRITSADWFHARYQAGRTGNECVGHPRQRASGAVVAQETGERFFCDRGVLGEERGRGTTREVRVGAGGPSLEMCPSKHFHRAVRLLIVRVHARSRAPQREVTGTLAGLTVIQRRTARGTYDVRILHVPSCGRFLASGRSK